MTELMRRRRALMAVQAAPSGRIPSEYQEVECIQASAGGYINTGIVPKTLPRIVMDVKVTDASNLRGMGGFSSAAVPYFEVRNNPIKSENVTFWFYSTKPEFASASLKQTSEWVSLDISNKFIVNGTTLKTISTYDFSNNSDSIRFFKGYQNGNHKQKETYVYDGATLKGDFVPCYRKSDTKIGMYDLVTNTFFPGTGTFYKGVDVT